MPIYPFKIKCKDHTFMVYPQASNLDKAKRRVHASAKRRKCSWEYMGEKKK